MEELDHFPLLPGLIVGKPTAANDAAVANYLEEFLEGENQGTLWRTIERGKTRTVDGGTSTG